jgi:glycosyltransferase involved in cell wall biosynthesis
MKIVYVTDTRLPGENALANQIIRNCEALVSLGHEVKVIYPWGRRRNAATQSGTISEYYGLGTGVQFKSVPNIGFIPPGRSRFFSSGVRLLTFLRGSFFQLLAGLMAWWERADLYLLVDGPPISAWMLGGLRRPLIIELHHAPQSLSGRILRAAIKRKSNTAVVAVTGYLARDIESSVGMDQGQIEVLHDAVNVEDFARDVVSPSSNDQPPLVVYTGSLHKNRGVDTLVAAAQLLPDIDFSIVGGNKTQVAEMVAEAQANGLSNIEFVGHVASHEVAGHMHRASLLVMPMSGKERHTAYYASPMKMFEYIATGIPLICTDVPSVREVLTHKETAYLVAPDDATALADGIRVVLSDRVLQEKLGANALALAQNYSWSARARAILRLAGAEDDSA